MVLVKKKHVSPIKELEEIIGGKKVPILAPETIENADSAADRHYQQGDTNLPMLTGKNLEVNFLTKKQ